MVTYWCVWCGETTERRTSREAPQCTRCLTELQLAFGFPLRTLMIPLEGTTPPGKPGAAHRRFTFLDPQGREIWTTSSYRIDSDPFTVYDDAFVFDHDVFTVYDVGA